MIHSAKRLPEFESSQPLKKRRIDYSDKEHVAATALSFISPRAPHSERERDAALTLSRMHTLPSSEDFKASFQAVDTILQKDPNNLDALHKKIDLLRRRAGYYYFQKDYKNVVGDCREILRISAESSEDRRIALTILGKVYAECGGKEEALKHFEQAISLPANSHQAVNNLAITMLLRGLIYYRIEEFSLAAEDLKRSLDIHSQNIRGWKILGQTLLQQDKMTQALDAFYQAHLLDPKDEEIPEIIASLPARTQRVWMRRLKSL